MVEFLTSAQKSTARQAVFTLGDVDFNFICLNGTFDVDVKILPDAQLLSVKKWSRPFSDVVKIS